MKLQTYMKKHLPILFLIAFLTFSFSGRGSFDTFNKTHCRSSMVSSSDNIPSLSPSTQSGNGIFDIRHRSALENETVIMTDYLNLVTFRKWSSTAISGYFSRWNGYFNSLEEILPAQPVFLSASGLRAPPLSA